MEKNRAKKFSVQQIVDCSSNYEIMDRVGEQVNYGCEGGFLASAFAYAQTHPIYEESEYPYSGQNQDCLTNSVRSKFKYQITDVNTVMPNDPYAVKKLVQRGPVAATISASSPIFKFYSKGIIDDLAEFGGGHM